MKFLKYILIFILISVSLEARSYKSLLFDLKHLNYKQKQTIRTIYRSIKNNDEAINLLAIAWQESSFGLKKVNSFKNWKRSSFGIFHETLPTARWNSRVRIKKRILYYKRVIVGKHKYKRIKSYKYRIIYKYKISYKRAKYLLLHDIKYNIKEARKNLKFWLKVKKGNLKAALRCYNGGFKAHRIKASINYANEVMKKRFMLKKYIRKLL